jgi:hypothetical protein
MRTAFLGWVGALVIAAVAGHSEAAPRDTRRFIPPNTPGQAGHVDLQLKADPPALVGPGVNLVVSQGQLTGELQGHGVNVGITGNHAEGNGPGGKISLDWTTTSDGRLSVKGVWNDHKVNLEFGEHSITGRLMQSVTPTGEGVKSCRFDIDGTAKNSNLNGLAECLGYSEPLRYSIQPAVNAELTNPEVALLLVAFFESPNSFAVR